MTRRTYDQSCPVAHALDLVGERWTLLIIRDLVLGAARFSELRDRLGGIAPNLLADRLRFLAEAGVVERVQETEPEPRRVYRLTERGRELSPVIQELARFGLASWDDPGGHAPYLSRGAVLALMMPERLGAGGWSARLELDHETIDVMVAPARAARPGAERPLGRIRVRVADPASPGALDGATGAPELCVRAGIDALVALRRGERTVADARRDGAVVLTGDAATAEQLGRLLGWC